MKRPLFFRIFFSFFFIAFVLSVLILLFSFHSIRNHYIETLEQDLEDIGRTLDLTITPLLTTERTGDLQDILTTLGNDTDKRITVIAPDGTIVADSENDPSTMDNHGNRPEIVWALRGETGTSLRFSDTEKEQMLYVAVPLEDETGIVGVLRISMYLTDIKTLLTALQGKLTLGAAILICIALLSTLLVSRTLSGPVHELSEAAKKVAAGNFDIRVFPKSSDDLQTLAINFNNMTERLSTLFKQISAQREELYDIVSSTQDGLLLLDKKGRIELCNQNFKDVFNCTCDEGKYFWEVIRDPLVGELFRTVKTAKRSVMQESRLNDGYYRVRAQHLEYGGKVLISLYDITDLKRLDVVKQDFVANVSHELRTPLTAIKGFFETIEDLPAEKRAQYLEIIKRNVDRMITLVSDLSFLSEIENRGEKLEIVDVDIARLVEGVFQIFEPLAHQKNVKLISEIQQPEKGVKADAFKIEQLLINLIDNSLKYTNQGEIRIHSNWENGSMVLDVSDTGIGIPKDDLPRIFERFYRVDKSRSRELGGTGLGLTIVKTIVLMHNGTITVKSDKNTGTHFTITIPQQ